MRVLSIGDIHGHTTWEKIVKQYGKEVDHIVFVGDYLDSFIVPHTYQALNFENLIKFKKANMEKVTLLIGNHDIPYMDSNLNCPGFSETVDTLIKPTLHKAIKSNLFKVATCIDGILYSHAGFTDYWLNSMDIKYSDGNDIANAVNGIYYSQKTNLKWLHYVRNPNGPTRIIDTGDDIWQGPTWVRPNALISDKPYGITQVVGHTMTSSGMVEYSGGVFLIDCLFGGGNPLILTDGNTDSW